MSAPAGAGAIDLRGRTLLGSFVHAPTRHAIDPAAPGGTIRLRDGADAAGTDLVGIDAVGIDDDAILYTASRANVSRVWEGGRAVG